MSTRKPALPPQPDLAIARAVTTAVADFDPDTLAALPAKARDGLTYFADVAEVADLIETRQPETLSGYRDDLVELLGEESAPTVDSLLCSHVLARLLADVAAGNVVPVATVTKQAPAKRKSKPKPAPGGAPTTQPKPSAPVPAPELPADPEVGFGQSPDDDF